MEILVVKMSALGDVVQALPVIPALHRGYPGARIHWLVEEAAEPIVRSHPGVHRVIVSPRGRWGRDARAPWRWSGVLREVRGLVHELKCPRYDLAVDLQGLIKSGVWMLFAEAERKAGYDGAREWSHLFLGERIPPVSPDLHAVERYLMLAEAVGGRASDVDFGLAASREAQERLWSVLGEAGWRKGRPYAVLVPAARWETKLWDGASFAAVGDWLVGTRGLNVAVTGVGADRPLVREVVERMREPSLDLCGRTDLRLLMALLGEASVVVTTDSGPMHLAVALGTPVVALFGPTAPWRTGPYGRGHRIVRAGLDCSPCFRRACSDRQCMGRIRPEAVQEGVADLLGDFKEAFEARRRTGGLGVRTEGRRGPAHVGGEAQTIHGGTLALPRA